MREKTQSWVSYIIVSLLILSFALWGISSYFGGNQANASVASVGGNKISNAQFSSTYRSFLQSTSSSVNSEQSAYLKKTVLKSMIERMAIMQYISKIGFAVNQEQIDAALMSVPLFSENNEFSPSKFKRFLLSNNISAKQFISDFAARMTMAQWDEGISMTSFSTSWDLSNTISLLKQTREIVYGVVKANLESEKIVSDHDLSEYYQAHHDLYKAAERVKIAYVLLNFHDLVNGIHPSEKDLMDYYAKNSSLYDSPEQWKVNIITVDNSHLSASEISSQVSQALLKSASLNTLNGASLSSSSVWLSDNNISSDLKSALMKTKINEVSSAFEVSPHRYIVYQLLDHKKAVNLSYEQAKLELEKAYKNDESNKKWAETLEEMSNLSYEHPDSLSFISKKFNVNIQSTAYFDQDFNKKTGLENNAEVISAAFSHDVLVGGNNSDVIKLDQGKKAIVLRVIDRIPAHDLSLKEVASSVKASIIKERALKKAKDRAEEIKKALESGQSAQEIQAKFSIILSKVSLDRFSQSLPNDVLQQSFVLPLNKANVIKINDLEFSIVQVLSINPGKISSIPEKDKLIYNNVITNEWAKGELLAYSDSIVMNSKVKIYDKDLKNSV